MQLCDLASWQTACHGAAGDCSWSFTPADGGSCNSYSDDTAGRRSVGCNGHDVSATSGSPDNDALKPTGSKPECYADFDAAGEVFDLSGNAKEWTKGPMSPAENPLRGGSYNNLPQGLTCDFDFSVGAADVRLPNVGFRCCTNTQP
jgi:formylglycine-generating enzyme required for sulfatase activity